MQDGLDSFGGLFTAVSLIAATLWLWLGRTLWLGRLRGAARVIVLIAIPYMFISRAVVVPVIAADKSYREFMGEVNQRVEPGAKLIIYGEFNSDPVLYYRGSSIAVDARRIETVAPKIVAGNSFVIMTEQSWKELYKFNANLPAPLTRSTGKGPESDAPLVLLQAEIS